MKIRLKQAWKIWPIGHIIPDIPANQARSLIARGVAEEVAAEKPESGLSKVLTIPNRMMAAPSKRAR